MMEYIFTLKDNNQKTFRLFVWFLFFLHVVAAGVIALNTSNANTRMSIYILLGFYGLVVAGYFYFRRRNKSYDTFSLVMALLYSNFWVKHVGFFALIAFVLVYFFVLIVQGKKTTVGIADQGINVTRIFKRTFYSWAQMDNVIMKDNLLTIDMRSNKLIQAEVVEGIDDAAAIKFNGYCEAQLKNNIQKTGS